MNFVGRITNGRLAATLAATALLAAGCGGDGEEDDGGEPETAAVSATLTLSSDLTDLYTRAVRGIEEVAIASDETDRFKAAAVLEGIASDADRLAGEARSVGGDEGRDLARAASCVSNVLSGVSDAVDAPLGAEAQALAQEAGAKLRGCLGDLDQLVTALASESESSSETLASRVSTLRADLNSLLADLVSSLAAVEETTTEEDSNPSGLPECTGANFPCFNSATGEVQEAETADFPECNPADVVIPCRDPQTGDIVYGD